MTAITKIETGEIHIVSGEGEVGTVETYTGTRTIRAIKQRLTKERCGGDRWARATIAHPDAENYPNVWIDIETGEYRAA